MQELMYRVKKILCKMDEDKIQQLQAHLLTTKCISGTQLLCVAQIRDDKEYYYIQHL